MGTYVNVDKYINKNVTFKRTAVGEGGEKETFGTDLEWARYLANKLGEGERIEFYLRLVRRHSLARIKHTLQECFKTSDKNIRKSRAALFMYLLKNNEPRRDNFKHNC